MSANWCVSVKRDGTVWYGIAVGRTPTGGNTWAWSRLGRVEKRGKRWVGLDLDGRHLTTSTRRVDVVNDLRWNRIDTNGGAA